MKSFKSHDTRIIYAKWDDLIVENNILYYCKTIDDKLVKLAVIPEHQRAEIIFQFLNIKSSHYGK